LRRDLSFARTTSTGRSSSGGILLLLRTPGLWASVPGWDDDEMVLYPEPRRIRSRVPQELVVQLRPDGPERRVFDSEVLTLVYGAPSFRIRRSSARTNAAR
jgi:hypothetical protein